MKLHWQILIALLAGLVVGGVIRVQLDAAPQVGASFVDAPGGGAQVVSIAAGGPLDTSGLAEGDVVVAVTRFVHDAERKTTIAIASARELEQLIAAAEVGEAVWFQVAGTTDSIPIIVDMGADSDRSAWLEPFIFVADLFLKLLKMLIVPVILTSIITGVSGISAGRDLRRLSLKTFGYYISTSVLAIFVGLALVNIVRPGEGAALGLRPSTSFEGVAQQSFWDVLKRMVPENLFGAMSDNGQMLQVIFFALLFGIFITRTASPHRERMREFFQAAFEVIMKLAGFVLSLIPYGVFALLVKVVGSTGFGLFEALGKYMLVVTAGLLIHALFTLPMLLKIIGGVSPLRWCKAMGPALLTAFSTSSSSMTLPVSLESVEKRGKVSNKVTSFVLPMGATINMDGTALYECAGVIFLAQYYQGISEFELTFSKQVLIVMMALLASVGAAGIPSAGLVMMLTILSTLSLPVEGAALLLAVDRPLDMMRTAVNVWSDTCGAALIASTEGETPLLDKVDSG